MQFFIGEGFASIIGVALKPVKDQPPPEWPPFERKASDDDHPQGIPRCLLEEHLDRALAVVDHGSRKPRLGFFMGSCHPGMGELVQDANCLADRPLEYLEPSVQSAPNRPALLAIRKGPN